ncbi:cytoplasmic trna 2-thiolation protein 2-like [Lichtheimia corymbifera JMRC:FSU:9682]|uniref:Cytoplasmic tRNA 2-thiolation protein 2 n=1 Tax=Lichtheimia corymbifera JMRC:FSU:9682 TaxID=1263082 RepID=A0A068RIH4_9FUNG|nr:cytoplasmic trna 2-thiolation protein 2-like [Lichtheimia corymbifera JMRC:FSU:9682]
MVQKACLKCKTADATVLIRHAYYCQTCFVYAVIGKYRTIINKSKAIARIKGKVLLACSGGPSSIAMLDLTKDFMHVEPHQKKKIQLLESATICHIDESALFQDQKDTAAHLERIAKEHFPKMDFITQPMEDVFSPEFLGDQSFSSALKPVDGSNDYELLTQVIDQKLPSTRNECAEVLRSLFTGIGKNSAKEDLYWHIKQAMLVSIARREKCSYIFMADSATRQAIKMISMTSKGRGYSIPLDVGAENDTSFSDVAILRPMKDMLAKEIGLYNRFRGLDGFVTAPTNFGTKAPVKSSIEKLTEHFIATLDRGFPSTVSTISRTTSKLTPSSDIDMNQTCAMCHMPYENGIEDWRRRITVSRAKDQEQTPAPEVNDASLVDVNQSLCYSCQVDLKDYKPNTIEKLPPYIAQTILQEKKQDNLREQIKDFILDDNL